MSQELFKSKPQHPGEMLKQKLSEKRWTQAQFAIITDKSEKSISQIARGVGGISPDMAIAFAAAFGNSPQEWLKWDYTYRLSEAEQDSVAEIQMRARIHDIAPIKDMQRRGWLTRTRNPDELERELKRFFNCESLDDDVTFTVATRRPLTIPNLTPSERAWCFRGAATCGRFADIPLFRKPHENARTQTQRISSLPKRGSPSSKDFQRLWRSFRRNRASASCADRWGGFLARFRASYRGFAAL